jgi:hypothetical protein
MRRATTGDLPSALRAAHAATGGMLIWNRWGSDPLLAIQDPLHIFA